MNEPVRVIFLGGVAEVGKNLLVLETANDIIVVDVGLGFPEEDQPGVDLVLPDIGYLKGRREKIRAIFITHGHEDHIGGLPYLWEEIDAPIYSTTLTAGLVAVKMREKRLMDRVQLHRFDPDERPSITAGNFTVEPFRVSHSIPDAVGFGITTPQGMIVVTGDFKFDPTPIDGKTSDLELLRQFGDRGVRVLISDCVHVEAEGRTPSERVVGETYEEIFSSAPGRIIIATFASLIARIQQVIDTAGRHQRKVATLGRSLDSNVRVAKELGYLKDPEDVLVSAKQAANLPDNEVVYIVTGSQGEPMAVLSRIANRDHHRITVGDGDTVIVSATPIPGNETSVFRIIDQLFRSGAEVIYGSRARVHVSGHASRDELQEMIELTRPEFVIPTHGEPRHLSLYADLAVETGIPRENIEIVDLGDVVVLDDDGLGIREQIDMQHVFVEGSAIGRADAMVLRDRQAMSQDGLILIAVGIDRRSGDVVSGPKIATRGFSLLQSGSELASGVSNAVCAALSEQSSGDADPSATTRLIRDTASKHIYSQTRRRPMILPLILDM